MAATWTQQLQYMSMWAGAAGPMAAQSSQSVRQNEIVRERCTFGFQCTRLNCRYDHPEGREKFPDVLQEESQRPVPDLEGLPATHVSSDPKVGLGGGGMWL